MGPARRADFIGLIRTKYCVAALPFGSAQGPEPAERGAQRPAVAKPKAGRQRGLPEPRFRLRLHPSPRLRTAGKRSYRITETALELRRARGAGEGDDVADVRHAGHEHEHALEAQAEAGVGHTAVAVLVEVSPVGFLVEVLQRHAFLERSDCVRS